MSVRSVHGRITAIGLSSLACGVAAGTKTTLLTAALLGPSGPPAALVAFLVGVYTMVFCWTLEIGGMKRS